MTHVVVSQFISLPIRECINRAQSQPAIVNCTKVSVKVKYQHCVVRPL